MFNFEITAFCNNTSARTGVFKTPHGSVLTPRFMPVGTLGTVKGISSLQLNDTSASMILSNTFHLHLQPGEKIIKEEICFNDAVEKYSIGVEGESKGII